MNELPAIISPAFVAILAIVTSVISIGASVTTIILTKKTKERDDARIAREEAAAKE